MDERTTIISSINELLTDLKDEELKFILKQAEVLDYNRRVREKRADAAQKHSEDKVSCDFEAVETEKIQETKAAVYIEQTERSKFFNICIGNARLFMDYQEMQALYKIAAAAASAEEGAPRLYRWFKKERSDVLAEGNIRATGSSILHEIYDELLETFTSS